MPKPDKPERVKPTLTVTLDAEQVEQLHRIRDTVGIPVSVQVRKAVDAWLQGREADRPAAKKTTTKKR